LTFRPLDCLYLAAAVLGLPVIVYKVATQKRLRAGWGERLGRVPELPAGRRIWVHCASVGEVLLARTLVRRLEAEQPDTDVVLSTNTSTGHKTAVAHYPGHTVFYFPLDLSAVVRRVFAKIKPSAVLLVELELWPNFLAVARRLDVPVAVVNGRITERSARRYKLFGPFSRRLFAGVGHFAVQNEEYARRLRRLGVPPGRVTVAGTMKYDAVAASVPDAVVEEYRRALHVGPGDEVIVGGCTHPGEEEPLVRFAAERAAAGRGVRLILAPRHSERTPAVESLVRKAGLKCVRKTAIDAGRAPEGFEQEPHVILIDTTGELARLYALADVVFIGGSLNEHGGHNVIEPAALGRPTVFGPNMWNFADTARLLLDGEAAVEVQDGGELVAVLDELLSDEPRRSRLGANARRLVEQSRGATARNIEAVRAVIGPGPSDETGQDAETDKWPDT
jgi:3-deoxy-D-manno-octulosonic-acid transferase